MKKIVLTICLLVLVFGGCVKHPALDGENWQPINVNITKNKEKK